MTRSKSHRAPITHINYPSGVKDITQDLPKDELVRRLKMLARSFQDMEQEEDNSKYESLAIHITENFFLKHSSKDVRLLVACCVADVFRIFAPEAPYRTATQLKTIFKFLCEQLWDLEATNSPLWKRYFYLLENLAMVKSFNICMELEDANEIFVRLFMIFFSIVNKNHPPKVRGFMLDVMCPLISENDSVSPDLLEVILKYLVESKKVENPFANVLAKDLIKRTATSIEPAMQTYFNNALVLGKSSDSELSSHTYELIYQLNLISSNLLLAVLPQLEFRLKTNEEKERLSVTKLLGRMFSEKESYLASNNKPLWNCFLGRFSDISSAIRIECVRFVPLLITNHPYLVQDVADRLRERVHDVEDEVRIEAVQALVSSAKKDISIITHEMLQLVKERTLDKRCKIRKEAILGLAHIYKKWCHSEEASSKDKERLLWIKDKILHSYYLPDLDDKLLVERIFTMNLVPYTLPVAERMQRFLELYVTVDKHSVKAIVELIKCQHIVRTHVRDLLEGLKIKTDGEQSKIVFSKIIAIGKCLPENNKTQDSLKKMVKALQEDERLLAFMKQVVSPDVTCKKAAYAVGEIMKKFTSPKSTSSPVYNTVKTMMERVAPLIQDAEATKAFLNILMGYIEGTGAEIKGASNKEIIQNGLKLVEILAHVYPYTFKSEESFGHLIMMIKNEEVPHSSDTALQTLTQVGSSFEDHFPQTAKDLCELLSNFAISGTRKQGKHSIQCINVIYTTSKKEILEKIFKQTKQNLNLEHEHFFTALTSISHIARLAAEQFLGPMKTVIAGTIVKGILMQDHAEGSKGKGIWCLDEQLCEETQGKLLAIKVLVHWLLGLGKNISGSVISTIRLLTTMLKNEGDLMERKKIGRADMSRLRLAAGCALLKLAQEPAFTEFVSLEQFQLIAMLINDECFQVRERFAEKLSQGLISLRLPLNYMSILSLCVKDPVKENQRKALSYVKQCITVRRQYLKQHNLTGVSMIAVLPEYAVPHTVHLLSHDPDFITPKDIDALNDIKECMWFMLEPLASKQESVNFIRKMLETIKQMKDAQPVTDKVAANKKLYAVCEVGLGLLTSKLPEMVIKDHPGDIVLPGRLFVKPKKPVNPRVSYLPKKLQQEFSQVIEEKEAEGQIKEDKADKKKQVKGAANKKKTESGDENQSPLGKKENKAEEKKEAKSRKVLTQKEENDLNNSRRSLRGRADGSKKVPREQPESLSPEVQSPKPKTKQTLMNKYVTSKKRSSDGVTNPSPQKSPAKRPSSSGSSSTSPAKRRKMTATPKTPGSDTTSSEKGSPVKETRNRRGVKAILNIKTKQGNKKMVKTNKVATIKRTGKDPNKTLQKRKVASPVKASPVKKVSPTNEVTKKKPVKTKATESPVKSPQPNKRTATSAKQGRDLPQRKENEKRKGTPSPKKSPVKPTKNKEKRMLSPSPVRSTRSGRAQRMVVSSPPSSQSPVKKPTTAKKSAQSPIKKSTPSQSKKSIPSPVEKSPSSPSKKSLPSPVKKSTPAAKKAAPTKSVSAFKKAGAAKKVASPPAKKSVLSRKEKSTGSKSSPSPARRLDQSPSKSPVKKPSPAKSRQSNKSSPVKSTVSRSSLRGKKPTHVRPASSPAKSPSPVKGNKSSVSKDTVPSPVKNTRRGQPSNRSPPRTVSTRQSGLGKRKVTPSKRYSPSQVSSPSKSPSKSPPKVTRVVGKMTGLMKPSPAKKSTSTEKAAKSPAGKKTAQTRSASKSPTKGTAKRKLVDSDSEAVSSPARSSSSSARSSPVKSHSPKKNLRQTSNIRVANKGSKATVRSGKNADAKRKAGSQTSTPSPKKRKMESPTKSPKTKSPVISGLNISRRSHRRRKL